MKKISTELTTNLSGPSDLNGVDLLPSRTRVVDELCRKHGAHLYIRISQSHRYLCLLVGLSSEG